MKKIKIAIILFSIILISFSFIKITQGYSDLPTIYFDGNKKEILFLNANNGDLFNNLKELMPGDKKSQDILFKLNDVKSETKVFLKVTDKSSKKLPDGITIKLYENGKELEEAEDLINIGTFSQDDEVNLSIEVKVDEEVGNEIQDLEYNLNWKFFIQENEENIKSENNNGNIKNNNDDLLEVPYTYDNSNVYIYIIICVISFIMMILSIIALKKENKQN